MSRVELEKRLARRHNDHRLDRMVERKAGPGQHPPPRLVCACGAEFIGAWAHSVHAAGAIMRLLDEAGVSPINWQAELS